MLVVTSYSEDSVNAVPSGTRRKPIHAPTTTATTGTNASAIGSIPASASGVSCATTATWEPVDEGGVY
jgi:hypothetical protein